MLQRYWRSGVRRKLIHQIEIYFMDYCICIYTNFNLSPFITSMCQQQYHMAKNKFKLSKWVFLLLLTYEALFSLHAASVHKIFANGLRQTIMNLRHFQVYGLVTFIATAKRHFLVRLNIFCLHYPKEMGLLFNNFMRVRNVLCI